MSATSTAKNINSDGIPINYDFGMNTAVVDGNIYSIAAKTLNTNTKPSEFIKAFNKYGKEAVVWRRVNGVGDHDSDKWKNTKGSGPQCPMDNVYIAVIGPDGKPEYRKPLFQMVRISVGSIKEPTKRYFNKGIITNVGVSIMPLKDGAEETAEYLRRKEFLECMEMFYQCLSMHLKDYKKAIIASYKEYYKTNKKSLKPKLKKLDPEDAAANFIELIDYGFKFINKVAPCTKKEEDGSKTEIDDSLRINLVFNMKESSTVWPERFPFSETITKKNIHSILDNVVSKQAIDESTEKDTKKKILEATVKNPTEENIHEFDLFKNGSQITAIIACTLNAFSRLGISCKPKFKKGTGGQNWVFIDASTAFTGGDGDDADDMLAMAGFEPDQDTIEESTASAALAMLDDD